MADTTQTIHIFMEQSGLKEVPDRIAVLPTPGTYPHGTYGNLDFSKSVIDQFVSNFNDGIYDQTLPIDVEHDRLSGSAGHITALHSNEDGSVDADVTWTPMGKQLLAEDRFRYISPSILTSWTSPATRTTHANVLTGAALTQKPFFKSASLRPLITASEPYEPSLAEGTTMSEKTPEQLAAEAEGSKIVAQNFGEKIADLERKFAESEAQRTEADTARKAAEDRVTALEAIAQERTFREQLAGATDIDDRVKELAALPVELHEGYIARAKAEAGARKQFSERQPIGSDALGDGPAKSAETLIAKRMSELQTADPSLPKLVARSRATEQVFAEQPDLYRDLRSN